MAMHPSPAMALAVSSVMVTNFVALSSTVPSSAMSSCSPVVFLSTFRNGAARNGMLLFLFIIKHLRIPLCIPLLEHIHKAIFGHLSRFY